MSTYLHEMKTNTNEQIKHLYKCIYIFIHIILHFSIKVIHDLDPATLLHPPKYKQIVTELNITSALQIITNQNYCYSQIQTIYQAQYIQNYKHQMDQINQSKQDDKDSIILSAEMQQSIYNNPQINYQQNPTNVYQQTEIIAQQYNYQTDKEQNYKMEQQCNTKNKNSLMASPVDGDPSSRHQDSDVLMPPPHSKQCCKQQQQSLQDTSCQRSNRFKQQENRRPQMYRTNTVGEKTPGERSTDTGIIDQASNTSFYNGKESQHNNYKQNRYQSQQNTNGQFAQSFDNASTQQNISIGNNIKQEIILNIHVGTDEEKRISMNALKTRNQQDNAQQTEEELLQQPAAHQASSSASDAAQFINNLLPNLLQGAGQNNILNKMFNIQQPTQQQPPNIENNLMNILPKDDLQKENCSNIVAKPVTPATNMVIQPPHDHQPQPNTIENHDTKPNPNPNQTSICEADQFSQMLKTMLSQNPSQAEILFNNFKKLFCDNNNEKKKEEQRSNIDNSIGNESNLAIEGENELSLQEYDMESFQNLQFDESVQTQHADQEREWIVTRRHMGQGATVVLPPFDQGKKDNIQDQNSGNVEVDGQLINHTFKHQIQNSQLDQQHIKYNKKQLQTKSKYSTKGTNVGFSAKVGKAKTKQCLCQEEIDETIFNDKDQNQTKKIRGKPKMDEINDLNVCQININQNEQIQGDATNYGQKRSNDPRKCRQMKSKYSFETISSLEDGNNDSSYNNKRYTKIKQKKNSIVNLEPKQKFNHQVEELREDSQTHSPNLFKKSNSSNQKQINPKSRKKNQSTLLKKRYKENNVSIIIQKENLFLNDSKGSKIQQAEEQIESKQPQKLFQLDHYCPRTINGQNGLFEVTRASKFDIRSQRGIKIDAIQMRKVLNTDDHLMSVIEDPIIDGQKIQTNKKYNSPQNKEMDQQSNDNMQLKSQNGLIEQFDIQDEQIVPQEEQIRKESHLLGTQNPLQQSKEQDENINKLEIIQQEITLPCFGGNTSQLVVNDSEIQLEDFQISIPVSSGYAQAGEIGDKQDHFGAGKEGGEESNANLGKKCVEGKGNKSKQAKPTVGGQSKIKDCKSELSQTTKELIKQEQDRLRLIQQSKTRKNNNKCNKEIQSAQQIKKSKSIQSKNKLKQSLKGKKTLRASVELEKKSSGKLKRNSTQLQPDSVVEFKENNKVIIQIEGNDLQVSKTAKKQSKNSKTAKPSAFSQSFDLPSGSQQSQYQLVECEKYLSFESQPYRIYFTFEVQMLMYIHSYLSKNEVIGMLGGRCYNSIIPQKNNPDQLVKFLIVSKIYPSESSVSNLATRQVNCEISMEDQVRIQEQMDKDGVIKLAWYHSHPIFDVNPSVTDLHTHGHWQQEFDRNQLPFLGVIIGPYFKEQEVDNTLFNIFNLKADHNQSKVSRRAMQQKLKNQGKAFHYKIIPKTKLKYSMYADIKKMIKNSAFHKIDRPDLASTWTTRRGKNRYNFKEKFMLSLKKACDENIQQQEKFDILTEVRNQLESDDDKIQLDYQLSTGDVVPLAQIMQQIHLTKQKNHNQPSKSANPTNDQNNEITEQDKEKRSHIEQLNNSLQQQQKHLNQNFINKLSNYMRIHLHSITSHSSLRLLSYQHPNSPAFVNFLFLGSFEYCIYFLTHSSKTLNDQIKFPFEINAAPH